MAAAQWDSDMMGLALEQAELALASREVPVGCVVARTGSADVLATGRNRTNETYNPTLHAEIVALRQLHDAGHSAEELAGCTLVVTVEPCILCAAALARAGVGRVVYGCPNPKFGGASSVLPVASSTASPTLGQASGWHPILLVPGVDSDRAVTLLQRFYDRANVRAPTSAVAGGGGGGGGGSTAGVTS